MSQNVLLRIVAIAVVGVAFVAGTSWGYTPDSPEVKTMIQRGLGYLERNTDGRVGGKCLVAMAFLKTGSPETHGRVVEAVAECQKLVSDVSVKGIGYNTYNETIACIFLCELDPDKYRNEIQTILTALLKRQRPEGGWTYGDAGPGARGDTSQTQYAVLAMWACHSAQFQVPADAADRALNWLMRTQDKSGGFAYQPLDSGAPGPSDQTGLTQSMTAAGLGSVYVCSHLLGFASAYEKNKQEGGGLPPALQLVSEKKKPKTVGFTPLNSANVNRGGLNTCWARGNEWIDKNIQTDVEHFRFYYLYGLERCQSFREIVEGKIEAEPAWYNHGVELMRKLQSADGGWPGSSETGGACDTAFCVLFLTRSTKKLIKHATNEEGTLIGGYGLPTNLTNAQIKDGKVVTPQAIKDVDDLLDLLGDAGDKDFDPNALPGNLSLDQDLTKRTSQMEKLRSLVNDEDYRKRRASVAVLAKTRDLNNVPALIYALTDPDKEVLLMADSGLRFISRKFAGFGSLANANEQQLQRVQKKWKDWYRSIKPDAEFIE